MQGKLWLSTHVRTVNEAVEKDWARTKFKNDEIRKSGTSKWGLPLLAQTCMCGGESAFSEHSPEATNAWGNIAPYRFACYCIIEETLVYLDHLLRDEEHSLFSTV